MDLNERINNPVMRHGLLMVKNAAGKDDVSNILHSTGIPRQVIIKDFTAKIAVSYYNTVVFTFLRGYSLVEYTGNQNVTPTGIYV